MLELDSNSGSNSFMKGVYINEASVIGISDLSGKPTYGENPDSIRDLAIEIEFDIGKSWTKKVIIKGDLRRENNKVVDWGGAFVVKDFFMKIGCFNGLTKEEIADRVKLLERRQIPADFLIKTRKKKIYILDYIRGSSEDGKPKYSTWNIFDNDTEQLKNSFIKSVAKGYPSNYKPELLETRTSNKEPVSIEQAEEFLI